MVLFASNINIHVLSQTPNATGNEAEFDRSKFSRRTKSDIYKSTVTANKHFETIDFCLPIRIH